MEINFLIQHINDFDTNILPLYDYVLVQRINNRNMEETNGLKILSFPELIQMIDKNFEKFMDTKRLHQILPILHHTIQLSTTVEVYNITTMFLSDLIEKRSDEESLAIVLQIIYQILKPLKEEFSINENELVQKLIQLMLTNDTKLIYTRCIACIELCFEKFKCYTPYLTEIWTNTKKHTEKNVQIILHFLDNFLKHLELYSCTDFWECNVKLLKSSCRNNKKAGLFIIRKTIDLLNERGIAKTIAVSEYFDYCSQNSWEPYLTVFANLEENQSHLILPSLEVLPEIKLPKCWMDILITNLLQNTNTLVIRKSVQYVLNSLNITNIDNDIVKCLLNALNHTYLYTGEDPLSYQAIEKFVNSNIGKFLAALVLIDWKAVPLHVCFKTLFKIYQSEPESILKQTDSILLFKMAAKIRIIQNRCIRDDVKKIYFIVFDQLIDELSIDEYLRLLESILNTNECITDCNILFKKLEKYNDEKALNISFPMFKILTNSRITENIQELLLNVYDKEKTENHGWFKILAIFYCNRNYMQTEFVHRHYGIDLKQMRHKLNDLSMPEVATNVECVENEFKKITMNESERPVLMENVVDQCTQNIGNLETILSMPHLFLDGGSWHSLEWISHLLAKSDIIVDLNLLQRLVNDLKTLMKAMGSEAPYGIALNIIKYCKNKSRELLEEYASKLLDLDIGNIYLAQSVFVGCFDETNLNANDTYSIAILARGLLFGEPIFGDEKCEFDYIFAEELQTISSSFIRKHCLNYLKNLSWKSLAELKDLLLEKSFELNIKKPRYFEHSKQHRLKLRIMIALAEIDSRHAVWTDQYLDILLKENNQSNVILILERIVAHSIPDKKIAELVEKISEYTNTFQVSIISVAFMVCALRKARVQAKIFIENILPWTMGQNFNTRLNAQLAVYHLVHIFSISKFQMEEKIIKKCFKLQLSDKKLNLHLTKNIRYNLCIGSQFLNRETLSAILFITNVPANEDCEIYSPQNFTYTEFKENYIKKESATKNVGSTESVIDIQRKMNPMLDIPQDVGLKCYDNKFNDNNTDMIVVASLINKLPNLGGISRTCEVFGIKNLVVDSVKHVEDKEFKSLSMTAENWLNFTEIKPLSLKDYLNTKKYEGYSIIGAEQTSKSNNFIDFKFPEKCVLLLGHEKNGIPSDLISLLDYTVEIPQSGMVRSLNVHVTAALFLWEYCKQHLIK